MRCRFSKLSFFFNFFVSPFVPTVCQSQCFNYNTIHDACYFAWVGQTLQVGMQQPPRAEVPAQGFAPAKPESARHASSDTSSFALSTSNLQALEESPVVPSWSAGVTLFLRSVVSSLRPQKGEATLTTSVFLFVNGVIAAPVLTLPFVMSLMGWTLGLLTFIIVAALAAFTQTMLLRACEAANVKSYDALIQLRLGQRTLRCFQVLMVSSSMGALLSMLMLCGDFSVSLQAQWAPAGTQPLSRYSSLYRTA